MSARKEFDKVKALSEMPMEKRAEWLSSAEFGIEFLKENASSDYLVLYASLPHVLIHCVLAPLSAVSPPDHDDLEHMHVDVDDCWMIQRSYGGGEGHRVYLEPPLSFPRCESLVGGEKLVYKRPFEGMKNYTPPIELSQKLVHCFGLHYLPERRSYCRLNESGDLEDVITVFREPPCDVVLMASRELAEYMALSQQALVRKFDFTRFILNSFSGWGNQAPFRRSAPDLFYHGGVLPGHASYVNGCQIMRTSLTAEDIANEWKKSVDPSNKRYETFKIQDWKNHRLVECSCAPDAISNYFTKSEKPYEVSPAFFKPEVLTKYKADPDKYDLKDRSISCRNSWYLKTYDINDAGQVHTYIVYLSQLPFEEQQYWRSFNEWPKEPISKRALQTDFEGTWATEHDPLDGIKRIIDELDRCKPSWWKARGSELSRAVLSPVTDSAKEWGDELLALDQLIIEGFVLKDLRILAKRVGTELQKDWGSLKIIEAILPSLGVPADQAAATIAPLRTLHSLRTKVKGHAAPSERRALEIDALTEHSTYRGHFQALSRECEIALQKVIEVLESVEKK